MRRVEIVFVKRNLRAPVVVSGQGGKHHPRNHTKQHERSTKNTKEFRVVCFVRFRGSFSLCPNLIRADLDEKQDSARDGWGLPSLQDCAEELNEVALAFVFDAERGEIVVEFPRALQAQHQPANFAEEFDGLLIGRVVGQFY